MTSETLSVGDEVRVLDTKKYGKITKIIDKDLYKIKLHESYCSKKEVHILEKKKFFLIYAIASIVLIYGFNFILKNSLYSYYELQILANIVLISGFIFSFKKFSYYTSSEIIILDKDKFKTTITYMHLVTNNAYKYNHKTKLICIYCKWQGLFNNYDSAALNTIDVCTLICPNCNVDAVLEDIYTEEQINIWFKEGFS